MSAEAYPEATQPSRGPAFHRTEFEFQSTDWQEDARCRTEDPDIFFPHDRDKARTRLAQSICAQCVVRVECLEYALTTGQEFGIWGGASEKELKAMLRRRRFSR